MPRCTEILPAPFDIAILCALRDPELKKVLDTGTTPWLELEPQADDPATYHFGTYVTAKGTTLRIVAASPTQMGMTAAAMLTTKMVGRFRPKLVAMVGIAAGVSPKTQGFGDILGPDILIDYGSGKRGTEAGAQVFRPDPHPINLAPILRNRLRDWQMKSGQLSWIRDRWQGAAPNTVLKLHVGPLGSGEAVVAADPVVDEVREHWRKLIGIEMEAYGVHFASQEAIHPPPMFLCLKSICDFADAEKKDDWQHYAAYTAAQLCQLFVTEEWERLFPDPR